MRCSAFVFSLREMGAAHYQRTVQFYCKISLPVLCHEGRKFTLEGLRIIDLLSAIERFNNFILVETIIKILKHQSIRNV